MKEAASTMGAAFFLFAGRFKDESAPAHRFPLKIKGFAMKKMIISLSFTFLGFALSGQIQEMSSRSPYGVQDAAMIDAMMPVMPGFGGSAREMLQQQSVKPFLMPVRRVGERGDETAYLVSACLEYYVNRDRNFKVNLSPDFMSAHLRKAGAMQLRDALVFLIERGTVSAAVVPYDADAISEAAFSVPAYRIANFLHIFRELSPPRHRIVEAKKALLRGNPVLVEIRADDEFLHASGSRFVQPGAPTSVHTLLVVGFDEDMGAFEVQACRGHEWGQNGYALMRYEDFDKAALNGYVLLPE